MSLRAYAFACALVSGAVQAQAPETLGWLRKIHDATQKLSYSGTFVYQNGSRSETSRITRYADAGGDIEKLEVMDGVPREIVREKDTVRCYLPGARLVKVDRRTERGFPALLPERITRARAATMTSRSARAGASPATTAGRWCSRPKDNLRYGYRLYADTASGMLLRAVTVDANGEQVEQFMFTQLTIGGVTRDMVRTRHASRNWRVEDAEASPARLPGWGLSSELPGFHKVVELKRRLSDSRPASQVVYSDGLAAVSVFIESLEGRPEPVRTGLASMGAIHIYTREVANHVVTVVGEAPAASVQRIANAVEYRRPQ